MILRLIVAWLFTGLYWPLVFIAHFLTLTLLGERWTTGTIRFWGKSILRIFGIRLIELNPTTISAREARIVILNHQSALDIVWPAAVAAPAPIAIGKKEVVLIPIINLAWWFFDFVRVNRKDHAKAMRALDGLAEKIVREKRSLYVAPEGTRSPDGSILPFKSGAFHLARQAGVPIYPIVVEGAFDILSRFQWIPRRGVIRIRYLPPISASEIAKARDREAVSALMEKVRGRMTAALDEIRPKNPENSP